MRQQGEDIERDAAAAHLERLAVDVVHVLIAAAKQQQIRRRACTLVRLLLVPPQLLDEAQKRRQACSWSCRTAFRVRMCCAVARRKDPRAPTSDGNMQSRSLQKGVPIMMTGQLSCFGSLNLDTRTNTSTVQPTAS
jgi:hypothetical protein